MSGWSLTYALPADMVEWAPGREAKFEGQEEVDERDIRVSPCIFIAFLQSMV